MQMNPNQLTAVKHVNGPCCVIAGAGSGKTAVLVTRIQALIEQNVPANRILAVTFSKKARSEMEERIVKQIGDARTRVCTFHSLGYNILKSESDGFILNKVPIREFQKINFITQAMKHTILEEQEAAPKHISSFIGILKSNLRKPHERPREVYDSPELNEIYQVYQKYEDYKNENGFYDYDDMGDVPVYRLRANKSLLEHMRGRWDYILVDEYQDTNPAQDELLRLIAPEGDNVFVVGDDYQSIYGFRGADVNNILNFPKRYPGASMVYLDINYRSTPEIVAASNALIQENRTQFQKIVTSGRQSISAKPSFTCYDDDKVEAENVALKIKRMHEAGCAYNNIAILYRINSISRIFEEALLTQDIPFKVQGGKKFFEQSYVADVIDYLRLAVNLEDSEALMRILNRPNRFFGKEYRDAVSNHMEAQVTSAWNAVRLNERAKEWRYRENVDVFSNQLLWLAKNKNTSVAGLLYYIYDQIGYRDFLHTDTAEDDLLTERMESVDELFSLALQFGSTAEFVQYADMQMTAYVKNENCNDAITMSTVHKAKGLEYQTVFIVSCIDGMFPHKDAQNREEERRIMYVAMTRAINHLELSAVEVRRENRVYVSPFIQEIRSLLKVENAPSARGLNPLAPEPTKSV